MQLTIAHLLLFESMSVIFGPTIPDVEFVFGTADSPFVVTKVCDVHMHDRGRRPPWLQQACKRAHNCMQRHFRIVSANCQLPAGVQGRALSVCHPACMHACHVHIVSDLYIHAMLLTINRTIMRL